MLLKLIPLIFGFQKRLYSIIYGKKYVDITNNADKTTKTFFTKNETLVLSAKTKLKSEETTTLAKEILKKYINEPEKLFKFIESKGTKVIVASNIDKVLTFFKEEEGFITPLKGFKALFLSIMINILSKNKIPVGFRTPEMFVMRSMSLNIYSLAHQFHHWLAYKKKLPGYEEETMSVFKNIWQLDVNPSKIKTFSINEILALKNAIERDKEAIEFVQSFAREQEGSKKSLNMLKEGKKVSL
ncbi:MAG: hypothetical protein WC197_02340 [Candidatus Gastranaerophilaceae bacterium]|jgi:hypothetical protein